MKIVAVLVLAASAALSACATPTVVDQQQVGDQSLTCQQIDQEIQLAQNYEKEARAERGVTGTNVAAAVFFWPALLVTASNTQDAIDAAEERQTHLIQMQRSKGC